MIEGSWRIESERAIVCGSWSEEALWQPAFDLLAGRTVTELATFGRLREMLVSLSNDLHVASFATTDGDPQWTLFDRRGVSPFSVCCRYGVVHVDS
jgi:hypothetical protein